MEKIYQCKRSPSAFVRFWAGFSQNTKSIKCTTSQHRGTSECTLSASGAALRGAEQRLFLSPFFWCQFCWGRALKHFWAEKHPGLPPSLQRKGYENWKLTSISESLWDQQTKLTPKRPMVYPQAPSESLPFSQEGSSSWWTESRHKATDSSTLSMRK